MIKRLRRRVVALTMVVVFISVAVIFSMLYVSTAGRLRDESQNTLQRVLGDSQAMFRPGNWNDNIKFPYFVVLLRGETIYLESFEYQTLEDEQLIEIVESVLRSGKNSGELSDFALRYLVENGPFSRRIAFVDISVEYSTLSSLLISSAGIAAGILLVFFIISLFISRKLTKPMETALEQQRRFIADASHELKTPLTVMLANTDLLMSDSGEEPENREKWLKNIKAAGQRMHRLICALLDQTSIDNDENVYNAVEVDLSDIINESILLFEPLIFESGRYIEGDVDENVKVRGNAESLRRLASILIDNARKYSNPSTSVLVELKVLNKKTVLFRVSDIGIVIPPREIDKIFTRFYRSDSARSDGESYGLGLSIAKSIVEKHKGKINCQSSEEATSFSVILPLAK